MADAGLRSRSPTRTARELLVPSPALSTFMPSKTARATSLRCHQSVTPAIDVTQLIRLVDAVLAVRGLLGRPRRRYSVEDREPVRQVLEAVLGDQV